MRTLFSGILARLLLLGSYTALLLAFFPILYIAVLALVAIILLGSLAILYFRFAKPDNTQPFSSSRIPIFKEEYSDLYKNSSASKRALRAIKISVFAVALNLILFAILTAHSWIFYIIPLNRELEPIRAIYSRIHETPTTKNPTP